jgi:anti-anti-sigma factor
MATSQMSLRGGSSDSTSGRRPTPSAPFRIVVHIEREVVRVCPRGEVDIETVGSIRGQIKTLVGSGATDLVLDLRAATFLDSAGLDLILEVDETSRDDGWDFQLIGGPAHVQRVFDLTGSRARLPFLTASQLSALLTAPGDARHNGKVGRSSATPARR